MEKSATDRSNVVFESKDHFVSPEAFVKLSVMNCTLPAIAECMGGLEGWPALRLPTVA